MSAIDLPAVVVEADETIFERRMKVLSMRNAGGTFTQIADRLNLARREASLAPLSVTTIRKDHQAALREMINGAVREDLIAEHRSVILDVRRANYNAMAGGDPDAAKIILATLEREARLFGLDAPSRVSVGVGTDVEFAETLASLIESIGYAAPKDLVHAARGERTDSPANGFSADFAHRGDETFQQTNDGARAAADGEAYGEPIASPIAAEDWSNITST